jgi:hypothetical protein
MKLFKAHRKLAVSSLALTVALLGGGVAFAYFTSTGGGTGTVGVGSSTALDITQIGSSLYDSGISPSDWIYSQASNGPRISEFGNEITLAPSSQPLQSVVVGMVNFGSAPFTTPITVNVYSPSNLTTPLTSDTATIAVPTCATPGTACSPTGHAKFDATFNNFNNSVVLPSTVVYGISLNALATDCTNSTANCGNDPNPIGSLNIALSNSNASGYAAQPSVGSDTNPLHWYIDSPQGGNGSSALATDIGSAAAASLTASTFGPTGALVDPGAGTGTADVPAVQFNAAIGGLLPGGPSQIINYTVSNPGSSSVFVSQVTALVTSISNITVPGPESCTIGMFPIAQGPAIDATLPGGGSVSGTASIKMIDDGNNQDNCQGATLNLSYSSN